MWHISERTLDTVQQMIGFEEEIPNLIRSL